MTMAWNHYLQCSHEIMSKTEVRQMLKEEGVIIEELPSIWVKDPGLPLKAVVGDVVKITRADDTIYYRHVIPRW
jgi:DNA-directed RNA polymerase subunit H (RpoH/RPB5)